MSKAKVTLSVDQELLGAVDDAVKREIADSRSAVVEEALRLWRLQHRRKQLEREIEVYYRAQTPAERREDRAWARFASQHAKRLWED